MTIPLLLTGVYVYGQIALDRDFHPTSRSRFRRVIATTSLRRRSERPTCYITVPLAQVDTYTQSTRSEAPVNISCTLIRRSILITPQVSVSINKHRLPGVKRINATQQQQALRVDRLVQSTTIDTPRTIMDNMKSLIDAVSDDRREDTATEDEAGQPNCRGAREGGQRGSSCGRRGPSGPPHWAAMTSHMGLSCGPQGGPPCGPLRGQPSGPPCGPPSFIHGSSGFGPMECPRGRGPPFMNGPPQWACPCDRGMPPMNDFGPIECPWNRGPPSMHGPHAFGPMACSWDTRPPWADEIVDTDSDEEHAGKASAGNAGKEAQERTQQVNIRNEYSHSGCLSRGVPQELCQHPNVFQFT